MRHRAVQHYLARVLYEFLTQHRAEILETSLAKRAAQTGSQRSREELEDGLPLFFDSLIAALRRDAGEPAQPSPEPRGVASAHAEQRQRAGFAITDVIDDYGSMCHGIMEVAQREGQQITVREFQIVNLILDEGMAGGVQRFQREQSTVHEGGSAERLGFVAHEMRNALQTAILSFEAVRTGRVGVQGRTGDLIDHSLLRLRDLISLVTSHVRLAAHRLQRERLVVKEVIEEAASSLHDDAAARDVQTSISIGRSLVVNGDRNLLHSLFANLLQNAIKYSRQGGRVEIRGSQGRDLFAQIEVEDECGGWPDGAADSLFEPFFQASANKSGLGLGLAITREIVEAHGGTISFSDLPGKGCRFTVRLPVG